MVDVGKRVQQVLVFAADVGKIVAVALADVRLEPELAAVAGN